MADLLDEAQRGVKVVIERRGVQFAVVARDVRHRTRRRSLIAHIDPVLVDGDWTWEWRAGRLQLRARRRRTP